jgi:hypothetical protein
MRVGDVFSVPLDDERFADHVCDVFDDRDETRASSTAS